MDMDNGVELTMEVGAGWVEGVKGKNLDKCESISNKIFKKEYNL